METITLARSTAQRKNPRLIVFRIEGRSGSVQFFRTLFDEVPATLTLSGTSFAAPKVKETAEARKARRALLPKLTPVEKLAQMEKRIASMRAKLVAAPAPAVVAAPPAPMKVVAATKANNVVAAKGKR